MDDQRKCEISNLTLAASSHGNRKYLPVFQKHVKRRNNKSRYKKIKNLDRIALKLDSILAKYYPKSLETGAVKKDLIDLEGFNWDFNSSITLQPDKTLIFWILDYGYSENNINSNQIIIHYGNNPIQ